MPLGDVCARVRRPWEGMKEVDGAKAAADAAMAARRERRNIVDRRN